MRKQYFGRKFKRDSNERKALFKSLMSELVLHGRIETTEEKAKAIKASAERLITKANRNTALVKSLVARHLHPAAIEKLVLIAPKFANRSGGYTRIIKLGRRMNDNASVVVMEWVEDTSLKEKKEAKVEKSAEKKPQPAKKREVVQAIAKSAVKKRGRKPVAEKTK